MTALLLVLGLAVPSQAQTSAAGAAAAPPSPAAASVWGELLDWQKELLVQLHASAAVRAKHGIPETNWEKLAPEAKGDRALEALGFETGRRMNEEIRQLRGKASMLVLPAAARKDREAFVLAAYSLDARYPRAVLPPGADAGKIEVLKTGARFEQELAYAEAHPGQAAAVAKLEAARAGAVTAGGLGRTFDGSRGGASAPSASGGATAPAKPPVPAIKWRYTADAPGADPKAPRDPAKEEAWIREILSTLESPVEREVLAGLAKEQAGIRGRLAAAAKPYRDHIAAVGKELQRTDLQPAVRSRLEGERRRSRKALMDSQVFSDELLVSIGPMHESIGAKVFWDQAPGPDGKRHVRFVFARALFEAPAEQNPKDAARKIATHELTHAADFYKSPTEFPEQRLIEPRAFRNHVLSFIEEGKPKGELLTRFAAGDYAQLSADPLGWMHGQFSRYVRIEGVGGGEGLWLNLSSDDVRKPEAALAWRLRYAFLYAFIDAPQLSGPPRDGHFRNRASFFCFQQELADLMVAVDNDASVRLEDKSLRFAELGAKTRQGREFIDKLKAFPKAQLAKLEREEGAFFDSLAPIR